MKKFLILAIKRAIGSYRVERLLEEIEKRGHRVDLICSSDSRILTDGVYVKNEKVDLNEYDFIYSIGNDDKHQYISTLAKYNSKARVWPDDLLMTDKFVGGVFLDSIDVPTPKTAILIDKKRETIEKNADEVGGFPCVIKKVTGSEGIYVSLVNSIEEVYDFLKQLPHPSVTGRKNIIFQKYIEESRGADFRVYCVGSEILGAIKRVSQGDDFRANISLGGRAEPVKIENEMEEYSKAIINTGNFLLVGIDFIKSDDGYLVVEINDSADFKGFEKATGIDVAGKIVDEFLK